MTPTVLAAAVPVIIGLVGVLTQLGIDSKWAPLLCLVFGLGVVYLFTGVISLPTILIGLITGLAANGAHQQLVVTPGAIAGIFKKKTVTPVA